MKNIWFVIVLILGVSSCYPPRVIYALNDEELSDSSDSIKVQLLKGSTTSLDGHSVYSTLFIEILNNRNSDLVLHRNIRLVGVIDTTMLHYDLIESDSLPCRIKPNAKNCFFCVFDAKDPNYLLYSSVKRKKGHLLNMYLEFDDCKRNKIYKVVSLKSVKKRKLVYENDKHAQCKALLDDK